MYTLVSASVLALDLTRHPSGAVVADVLDRALALAGTPAGSRPSWSTSSGPPRAAGCSPSPRPRRASTRRCGRCPGRSAPPTAAPRRRSCRRALVGRLTDLVALLERELGQSAACRRRSSTCVVDRAVAAWTAADDAAGADDVERAERAVRRGGRRAAGAPPVAAGPSRELLVAARGGGARPAPPSGPRSTPPTQATHSGLQWSELVHVASRAAVGERPHRRRRPLAAVGACAPRTAPSACPAPPPARRMSLVGAVQALAVADVLPDRGRRPAARAGPRRAAAARLGRPLPAPSARRTRAQPCSAAERRGAVRLVRAHASSRRRPWCRSRARSGRRRAPTHSSVPLPPSLTATPALPDDRTPARRDGAGGRRDVEPVLVQRGAAVVRWSRRRAR